MDQHEASALATELPTQLRRELTRALASKPHAAGLDRYVLWLQDAIQRLGEGSAAEAIYGEWVDSRPRCARRAMKSGSHVHA